jgi:hypothetical protein
MPSVSAVSIVSRSTSHLNVISFYTTVTPLDTAPLFVTTLRNKVHNGLPVALLKYITINLVCNILIEHQLSPFFNYSDRGAKLKLELLDGQRE